MHKKNWGLILLRTSHKLSPCTHSLWTTGYVQIMNKAFVKSVEPAVDMDYGMGKVLETTTTNQQCKNITFFSSSPRVCDGLGRSKCLDLSPYIFFDKGI